MQSNTISHKRQPHFTEIIMYIFTNFHICKNVSTDSVIPFFGEAISIVFHTLVMWNGQSNELSATFLKDSLLKLMQCLVSDFFSQKEDKYFIRV